jgi:hypothetical protein
MELAFENQYYWDLKRWRTADVVLNNARFKGLMPYYVFNENKYIFLAEPETVSSATTTLISGFITSLSRAASWAKTRTCTLTTLIIKKYKLENMKNLDQQIVIIRDKYPGNICMYKNR